MKRTARLASLALVGALAFAACGNDDSDDASATSGDATGESASATTGSGAEEATVHDAGSLLPAMKAAMGDGTSARVQMEMTGAAEMSMDGRMVMTRDIEDARLDMTMEIQGQRVETRVVDGLVYLKGGPFAEAGKWAEVDPADTSDPRAAYVQGFLRNASLTTTFDAFEAGMTGVEHVGEDEIGGEHVQHYEIQVDTARAMEAQGTPVPPGMPSTLTYEVWLTPEDLMRRVSFELPGVAMTLDATEWGEPVEVEAPPADQIADDATAG